MADRTWYWQQVVTKTTDDDLRAVEVNVGQDPQYEYFQANVITYVSKPASIAQDATININGSGGSNNNQNGTDP